MSSLRPWIRLCGWTCAAALHTPSPSEAGAAGQSALDRLGISALHDRGFTGDGVRIAVLDSGQRFENESLANVESQVIAAWDFVDGDGDPAAADPADDAHGSRTFALVAGAAPDASFILARVEDTTAEGPEDERRFVQGCAFALHHGADVALVALGYPSLHAPSALDGQTTPSARAVEGLVESGVVVVVAVGNGGPDLGSVWTPADAPHALSVGAVDDADALLSISSRGPLPDGRAAPSLTAPGFRLVVPIHDNAVGSSRHSGTSFAAALVAGGAALVRSARWSDEAQDVVAQILSTGARASAPVDGFGVGLPDFAAAVPPGIEPASRPPTSGPRFPVRPARPVRTDGGTGCSDSAAALLVALFRRSSRRSRTRLRDGWDGRRLNG